MISPSPITQIKIVQSFDQLINTPFGNGINALCWERSLSADFTEVVAALNLREEIITIEDPQLLNLSLSEAGQSAVHILLEDQRRLRDLGLSPVLDWIRTYPRDEDSRVPTDVYSFHADSATVETDTFLCTYHGSPSEGIRNDESIRQIDIPQTRTTLLQEFGGEENPDFHEYLKEACYHLHYAALPQAKPFSFGLGHLWRIAVDYPGCPVPPCIHRAPPNLPNHPPRLLLIS